MNWQKQKPKSNFAMMNFIKQPVFSRIIARNANFCNFKTSLLYYALNLLALLQKCYAQIFFQAFFFFHSPTLKEHVTPGITMGLF